MIEINTEVLAQRLRFLRTEVLGLSVPAFCEKAGFSPSTYWSYMWQKHKPMERVVRDIATALGVSAEWLMGLKEEM